jgi:hypothetical protein
MIIERAAVLLSASVVACGAAGAITLLCSTNSIQQKFSLPIVGTSRNSIRRILRFPRETFKYNRRFLTTFE